MNGSKQHRSYATHFTHPGDVKTILHSKRANLYYLEHCRILVNGGRVEYLTDGGKESLYWNIPIANTTCILLGTGTSVTQAAVRELSKGGGKEADRTGKMVRGGTLNDDNAVGFSLHQAASRSLTQLE